MPETDHTPLACVEVKNEWSNTATPLYLTFYVKAVLQQLLQRYSLVGVCPSLALIHGTGFCLIALSVGTGTPSHYLLRRNYSLICTKWPRVGTAELCSNVTSPVTSTPTVPDCKFQPVKNVLTKELVLWLHHSLDLEKVLLGRVSRNSSVGKVTRYVLWGPGIESRWGARFFAPVQTGPGAHPTSRTMGTGSFPGVKRPGRGVNHPHHLAPRLKKG